MILDMSPDVDRGVVRIFVGCDPNDCDLEQMMVLDHSLHRHATVPLEIHWMRLSRDSASPWYSDAKSGRGWRTERWATPFSGFRWAVPAVCGFQGRAIYMDADILALGDIAELWRAPITRPAVVLARYEGQFPRFCVSLWDCSAAREHLPTLESLQSRASSHAHCSEYFKSNPRLMGAIDPAFNNIDGEGHTVERIRLLHYSDMGTQFSHRLSIARLESEGKKHWFDGDVFPHPRSDLTAVFDRLYEEALASGRNLDDYRNPSPFGNVVKKSQRRHRGNTFTRPRLHHSP